MQQWAPTCSIEFAIVQGVRGLHELLGQIYAMGLRHGGLPHWGQLLDIGSSVTGHARMYENYTLWREVYASLSGSFSARTFENDLSSRWGLTSPP
jgi:hypothetical protein